MKQPAGPMCVYLPDCRDVRVSRFGRGNTKIGPDVFTYSRIAPDTCPGASPVCREACYARCINKPPGPLGAVYAANTATDTLPHIPAAARLLRLHISGDFDCPEYIWNWVEELRQRPDVRCWAYTRSWMVPELLDALELLRRLPNVQVFASMDAGMGPLPPRDWRIAWLDSLALYYGRVCQTRRGDWSYVCPEQTGHKQDCQSCRYCFDGKRGDVTFLQH